jgi:putative SOS response-associated peptidase YedK
LAASFKLMKEMDSLPPFERRGGRIPNDASPIRHTKITEKGLVIHLEEARWPVRPMTWTWKTPEGKRVFNFVWEKGGKQRPLSYPDDGFLRICRAGQSQGEAQRSASIHPSGHEWLWIAGIVKQDAFAMLTTAPGPDMKPYHDRQIVVLPPDKGMDWLALSPKAAPLKPLPAGSLAVQTLRRDGNAVL